MDLKKYEHKLTIKILKGSRISVRAESDTDEVATKTKCNKGGRPYVKNARKSRGVLLVSGF